MIDPDRRRDIRADRGTRSKKLRSQDTASAVRGNERYNLTMRSAKSFGDTSGLPNLFHFESCLEEPISDIREQTVTTLTIKLVGFHLCNPTSAL
jgi:hypothetical protein